MYRVIGKRGPKDQIQGMDLDDGLSDGLSDGLGLNAEWWTETVARLVPKSWKTEAAGFNHLGEDIQRMALQTLSGYEMRHFDHGNLKVTSFNYKCPVMSKISFGEWMSMLIIANNIILYTCKLLGDYILNVLTTKKGMVIMWHDGSIS